VNNSLTAEFKPPNFCPQKAQESAPSEPIFKRQCAVSDFQVLDIGSRVGFGLSSNFKFAAQDCFKAESCSRLLLAGPQQEMDALESLAKKEDEYIRANLLGKDAYNYLLRVATGLESQKIGEPQILGQVQSRWHSFYKDHEFKSPSIQRIMQNLITDAKAIRTHILSHLKSPGIFPILRDVLSLSGDERVLLAAETPLLAKLVAWNVAGASKHRAGELIVCCANPDELEKQMHDLECEAARKMILSPFRSVSLVEGLNILPQEIDHAIIAIPMASNSGETNRGNLALDRAFIETWRAKQLVRPGGFIVHTEGNPATHGKSEAEWNALGSETFISPELLRQKRQIKIESNQLIVEKAGLACEFCAEVRLSGASHIDTRHEAFSVL